METPVPETKKNTTNWVNESRLNFIGLVNKAVERKWGDL